MASEPLPRDLGPSGSPDGAPVAGRRATARLRLAIPARFVSIYSGQPCILMDLSSSGARMALAQPVARGQSGYVAIGRLEMFGMIVRAERHADMAVIAMAFDEPLARDVVLAVRSFAEGFEEREHRHLRDQVRRWVTGER
jgi:hypothetical protein